MVDAKLRGERTCLYCGKSATRLDEEGVGINCCKDKNDEELKGYVECDFCENEVRGGSLIEFDGQMGCSDCIKPCRDCGGNFYAEDGGECDYCGNEYCSDCMNRCKVCEDVICSKCSVKCSECGNIVCPDCSDKHKGKVFCEGCLDKIEKKEEKQSVLKCA